MLTHPVFYVDATGTPSTTHVSCHGAANVEAAKPAAVHKTAEDWACDPNDVHARGVAVGNVHLLAREDEA